MFLYFHNEKSSAAVFILKQTTLGIQVSLCEDTTLVDRFQVEPGKMKHLSFVNGAKTSCHR